MKIFCPIIFFALLSVNSLLSKESLVTGNLIGSGQYLETEEGITYTLKHSELAKELMDLTGKKVRMLCEIQEDSCSPQRYEVAPFLHDKNLSKWTLKPNSYSGWKCLVLDGFNRKWYEYHPKNLVLRIR